MAMKGSVNSVSILPMCRELDMTLPIRGCSLRKGTANREFRSTNETGAELPPYLSVRRLAIAMGSLDGPISPFVRGDIPDARG